MIFWYMNVYDMNGYSWTWMDSICEINSDESNITKDDGLLAVRIVFCAIQNNSNRFCATQKYGLHNELQSNSTFTIQNGMTTPQIG